MIKNYVKLLEKYVGFETVSLPGHQKRDQVDSCLRFLKNLILRPGVSVKLWEYPGLNPILFAEYITNESLPTVLVYGHYDVVSVEPEKWKKTTPFVLKEDGGFLYGRGATDNKGQNLIHIMSVLRLIESCNLACNVKFFIEGNEETGSEGIENVIKEHKEHLKADYFLVSDGEMIKNTPMIERSLRGLVNIKVTVKTSEKDNHSGLAGGVIPNSVVEAMKLISCLIRPNGSIRVNGFYDGMSELINDSKVANDNKELSKKADVKSTFGVKALKDWDRLDPLTLIGLYPTIELMGIHAGGNEGFSHIIPGQTTFGLNIRLVGTQDPLVVADLVKDFLIENTPKYVDLEMQTYSAHPPIMINLPENIDKHLHWLLKEAYGEDARYKFVGGGIPIVEIFRNILGVTPLLVPLANDGCNMHGADENISLWHARKAFEFSNLFFQAPLPV